jgi:hypothetical protein
MSDQFGTIFSRTQLEQAVLNVLQSPPPGRTAPLIVYYLAEVERTLSLAARTIPVPPGPSSYRGTADTEGRTLMAEWFPELIVECEPSGDAQMFASNGIVQRYAVDVSATVGDDDEDIARLFAGAYGAAITRLIVDNPLLGGAAVDTVPLEASRVELLESTIRQVARSVSPFECVVMVASLDDPPVSWQTDPYMTPGDVPTVETTSGVIVAVPVDESF